MLLHGQKGVARPKLWAPGYMCIQYACRGLNITSRFHCNLVISFQVVFYDGYQHTCHVYAIQYVLSFCGEALALLGFPFFSLHPLCP